MVTHSVYFWLDPALTSAQRAEFERGMAALFEIDAVSAGRYGKAAATPERPVTQNSFDYALFLDFASVAAHNIYQDHPGHAVFVRNFAPWFREVRVFDAEVEGTPQA